MKKILIAVTSHDRLGYTAEQTGLYLEEFASAYFRFLECGLLCVAASPAGGAIPIDPRSVTRHTLGSDGRRFISGDDTILDCTEKLADVDPDDFSAVYYPGGHGPMWDLANDHRNARIASSFLERGKPVGTVCHGTAALLKARRPDGYPAVYGRRLTGFSNREEQEWGTEGVVPFLLEDRLKELGAVYCSGRSWNTHVVIDENLISGQNPHSAPAVAEAMIRMIRRNCGRIPLNRSMTWRYEHHFI